MATSTNIPSNIACLPIYHRLLCSSMHQRPLMPQATHPIPSPSVGYSPLHPFLRAKQHSLKSSVPCLAPSLKSSGNRLYQPGFTLIIPMSSSIHATLAHRRCSVLTTNTHMHCEFMLTWMATVVICLVGRSRVDMLNYIRSYGTRAPPPSFTPCHCPAHHCCWCCQIALRAPSQSAGCLPPV